SIEASHRDPSHRGRRRLSSRLPPVERADSLLRDREGQDRGRMAVLDPLRGRDDRGHVVAGWPRGRPDGASMTPLAAAVIVVVGCLAPPALAHHVGSYTARDNEVSTNFKQIKFSLQAGKFDVALRLFEGGPLRKEMQTRAGRLPAGLESSTRAALRARDTKAAELDLALFVVAL